jgi:iron complex outermembrane receptor protein
MMVHALHGQTQFAAPSVTCRPNQRLSMNLNVEYRNNDPLTANGSAAIGNRPADIPISTYLGGDIGDWANVHRKVIDFNGSYQVNSGWRLHGAAAVTFDDIDFEEFFGGSLDETPGPTFGDYTNIPWFDKRRSKGGNGALDLTGQLRTRGMQHTLLIGTDYYQLDYADRGFVNGWNPVDTMNIFHPVYGRSTAYGAHTALAATAPDWTSVGNTAWNGLYVQDQVRIWENVHLLLGGRYDWTRATSGSITLEYVPLGATLNDVEKTTARERKLSPQVGLLYQARPWLGLYGNYVNSLGTWGTSSVVATDLSGHPLPAQRSSSYEGGAKVNALNGHINSTVSVFHITKSHVATRDLSSPDPNALRDIGEARSSGVEVDTTAQVTARLSVLATYAFTRAKFTKDNSGLQGLWIANVPRHSGSAWLRAELIRGRLSAGAGAFLRGQRQGDNENTFQLPGYVTVDAYLASHFRVKRTRVTPQVNFTNLLDKRYFLNTNVYDASPRLGIMPGQPFSVTGSIRWEY